MADISLEALGGKLNRVGYQALFQALRHAKNAGNRRIELAHLLLHILQQDRCDLALTLDRSKLSRARVLADVTQAVDGLRSGQTEMPDWSKAVFDAIERGWLYATLAFGETQVRTGHLLVGALRSDELRRTLSNLSPEFGKLNADTITDEHRTLWAGSEEEVLQPVDGSGVAAAQPGAAGEAKSRGQTALDRFSQDLTAKAAEGGMDPVLGRDEEIRQVIDVLLRRRQNNPILTGEAGVGKTAVAEGLAQRIAAGDVPPPLKGVRLLALDIGLMQAGASMKGEFEQRLRSVIDEVQASPTPIILFIDEAHTLIGAGGAAGTGDAANLMKPPLARGTLRTVAATTWSEYRQYIEKDPALTRRFQPIQVDEPDAVRCARMLRGVIGPMEAHHKVRIADAAVVAAVELSLRYVPARQLPDKAVSLLDTACARVAISQNAVPAAIADARANLAALDKEKSALHADRDLGIDSARRLAEIVEEEAALAATLAEREAEWAAEQRIVADLAELRGKLAAATADGTPEDVEAAQAALAARAAELEAIPAERRMIHAYVDAQAVASVISDWTGIPVGRMVKNEIEAILNLPEVLNRRVIGQSHGLAMIAKRIETSRAKLDNPSKPIGVFLLCGPSGVGKTETALALAEALYGGEQNVITINMSEFQEAHTVSSLKGAPPGYVGYGEGGRLTEAVRRKPYSVVLLDEVEKAHPDVHELFFQVFDKGVMEDGNGRRIDFRNTLIILTSNVGTDLIMDLARNPAHLPDAEALAAALRPELLKVFPPALIGRLVPIPYFPLSPDMLTGIVRLQLDRIGKRIRDNHKARFTYDEEVVAHIVAQCNDPDSGGRMIDNIITNSLLPALSREFLKVGMTGAEVSEARVGMGEGGFVYGVAT
ncbi:type VI secretion system ATPase TssH [Aquabacter sp. L1I39]|uniref:type VI secretion system ATPase TssH n=1 Tax=Aquabacter sp. L1I39 TaxID=2820278 RepID=UPI001ADB28A9|nr:type VI secretion system ATPase TssH [Aquabacter sp. L1I39]QTL04419.1 type VI secretion system ATPase TssH [Aquabacter sp. L1I39]